MPRDSDDARYPPEGGLAGLDAVDGLPRLPVPGWSAALSFSRSSQKLPPLTKNAANLVHFAGASVRPTNAGRTPLTFTVLPGSLGDICFVAEDRWQCTPRG